MGIFESLKRTFNISGCDLGIRLDTDDLRQGDTIAGEVVLRGGEYEQRADELRITLVEFWTERRGSGKNSHTVTVTHEADAAVLAAPCVVRPGEESAHRFSLHLPPDSRLSQPGRSEGWRLLVRLDVPGAVDPTATLGLKVEVSESLLALMDLWEDCLRWSGDPDSCRWRRADRSTCFRLYPPAELEDEFDHLDVACRPAADGSWLTSLCFDLQEKTFVDRLKAIIDIDKAMRSISIPLDALAGDGPEREACARQIQKVVKEVVSGRQ